MLRETASGITNSLFGGREYLNKEEFLHKLSSKALDPILTVFLLLIRSEFVLFEDKAFQHYLAARS